ncbi:nuclear transport factor 2 family protein [Amycolatopsis sp. H20-H5]|uniref:nuclear transport factor 2 family protein n=1 Tax=Amycolatopsis sp. H20-H5 TaxID=3046309 RepID=UPI002DB62295|nr:nuclear transport factor 2 family protein [Amycolatopsis sp. H20-H5]MEC3981207.1 nuclear transport factor 2 family protein [Amycolatopsis sp. H20-H5]
MTDHQADAVVTRAMEFLLAHDMAGFAGLWATGGTIEFPFAQPGYPQRIEGRDAVRAYLRDYTDHVDVRAITSKLVHETTEPGVVIVEFEVDGVTVATGRPYVMRYISVITVRDGEIHGYRDYWSPLAAAEAMGSADTLLSAFSGAGDE